MRLRSSILYRGVSLSWLRFSSGVLSSSAISLGPEEHRDAYVEPLDSPTSKLHLLLCFPGATVIQKAQVGMMEGDSKSPEVYLKEYDQNQLNPAAGEAILPSPQGSLTEDSLHRKDDVTVAGGSVSCDDSASTANAPATPSSEAGPSVSPRNSTITNYEIKHALRAEIRRYGRRKYSKNG